LTSLNSARASSSLSQTWSFTSFSIRYGASKESDALRVAGPASVGTVLGGMLAELLRKAMRTRARTVTLARAATADGNAGILPRRRRHLHLQTPKPPHRREVLVERNFRPD